MWAVLPYLLPLGIVITANWGVTRHKWKVMTYLCLALFHLLTLLGGLLLLATPALLRLSRQPTAPELQSLNFISLGWALVGSALLGFACLLTPLRRGLAHWLPIDPASPVQTVALTFFVYLATTSLGLLFISQDVVNASLEAARLGPVALLSGQVVFLLFALTGVGLGLRRNVRQTLARLGLQVPSLRHLAVAAVAVIAFLVLDYITSLLWHRFWPANYKMVSQSSAQLFASFMSPLGALLLALSAGIGEEALFRGALQPCFRIPLTAALFAVSHVQYTLSPATVEIFIIGLVLGWMRERFNTTTCMVVHAGYNFLDILLIPWLP